MKVWNCLIRRDQEYFRKASLKKVSSVSRRPDGRRLASRRSRQGIPRVDRLKGRLGITTGRITPGLGEDHVIALLANQMESIGLKHAPELFIRNRAKLWHAPGADSGRSSGC